MLVDLEGVLVGDVVGGGLGRPGPFVVHADLQLLLVVEALPKAHQVDPALQMLPVRDPGQRVEQLEEDLLGDVPGVLRVAQHLGAEGVDGPLPGAEQGLQGPGARSVR
jgi:hypothetical protein